MPKTEYFEIWHNRQFVERCTTEDKAYLRLQKLQGFSVSYALA